MDTVDVGGRQVPITELVAYFAQKDAKEQELQSLRASQTAANEQLARTAEVVDAVERAKTDPQFARRFVDALAAAHANSAFFRDSLPGSADPDANGGDPVNLTPPPTGAPPVAPPAPPAGANDPMLSMARQLEELRAQVAEDQQQRFLDSKLNEIREQYPTIDTDALLRQAIERKLPIDQLDLLAGNLERERLAAALKAKETNNSLLDGLLGGAGDDADDALARLGSSLSAAQVGGDAGVDYANLSTSDAILLAMKEQGAAPAI